MKRIRPRRSTFRQALPDAARTLLLLLLVVGALCRPVLLLACEQHASLFDHSAQLHEHAAGDEAGGGHDDDSGEALGDGAHGEHQTQAGATPGAADLPSDLTLFPAHRPGSAPPPLAANARADARGSLPFRPPIA